MPSHTFYQCEGVESVAIPDSVTGIGPGAFGMCLSLQSITIPESVIRIKAGAFRACECLESITMPESLFFSGCVPLQIAHLWLASESLNLSESWGALPLKVVSP